MPALSAPLPLAAGGAGLAAPLTPSTASICCQPRALLLTAARKPLAARWALVPARSSWRVLAALTSGCLGIAGRALAAAALPLLLAARPGGRLVAARPLCLALARCCRILCGARAAAAEAGATLARRKGRRIGAQGAPLGAAAIPLCAASLLLVTLLTARLFSAGARPRRAVVTGAAALAAPPLKAAAGSGGLLAAAPHVGGAACVLELVRAKACRTGQGAD